MLITFCVKNNKLTIQTHKASDVTAMEKQRRHFAYVHGQGNLERSNNNGHNKAGTVHLRIP